LALPREQWAIFMRARVDARFAELASAARAYADLMHRLFASRGRIAGKPLPVSCGAIFRSKFESKNAITALKIRTLL
jgi:hypothetical protein